MNAAAAHSAIHQQSIEDLPPALSSMWRACKLGYRHEPSLMFWSFALAILAALPDALLALWLALLVAGVQAQDATRIKVAALALALSAAGTWLLRVLSTRLSRRFRD